MDDRPRYTPSLGNLPLREAIAEHYATTYAVTVSPDQILVTAGTSPAMLLLFGHLLDPGDEVVLSDPYYACYPNFIRYAEGDRKSTRLNSSHGYISYAVFCLKKKKSRRITNQALALHLKT